MTNYFAPLLSRLSVLGLLLVLSFSCTNRDNTVADPKTITDQILEDKQFGILRAAMTYAEAGDALKAANITFFAPNDAAFQNSGLTEAAIRSLPKEQVKNMLLYHVLYSPVSLSSIPSGVNTVQTASQGVAYLNNAGSGTVYINNAKVTQPDVKAANGVIHIIDHVLTPSSGSLLATIQSNPTFTFLAAALKRISTVNPSLIATLSNTASANPITIFAPTDDAFIASGYKTIASIEAISSQALSSLLTYHMLAGATFSYQFQSGSVNTLLTNNRLTLVVTNGVVVIKGNKNPTTAMIRKADQPATNGVIHSIDQVLQP